MNSEELIEAIQWLGWNQKDCAKNLGVTEGAVSRWVHGKRKIPGPVDRLMKIKVGRKKKS